MSPSVAGRGGTSDPDASVRDASLDGSIDAATTDAAPAAARVPLGGGAPSGESGGITYFSPFAGLSFPVDVASDAAGNGWFATAYSIVRITPAGLLTTFDVPLVDGGVGGGFFITGAPDGNVWFASASGSIGRITPAGTITFYWPAASMQSAFELVTGGDGNLWFDVPPTGKIAKLTTAGMITELAVSGKWPEPSMPMKDALAVATNGDVWFPSSLDGSGFPGLARRRAADGSVSSFPGVRYASIAVDSTNNAWFTGESADLDGKLTIGRVDAATSELTLYSASCPSTTKSSAGAHFGVAATGPGDAVWFTDAVGATLGRIDTATRTATCFHAFGNFPNFGTAAFPTRIAPAPDGSVWFVESIEPAPFGGFSGSTGGIPAIGIGHLVP